MLLLLVVAPFSSTVDAADENRINRSGSPSEPTVSPEPAAIDDAIIYTYNQSTASDMQVGVFATDGTLTRRLRPLRSRTAAVGIVTGDSEIWNGRDDAGAAVASGATYSVRFTSGGSASLGQSITSSGAQIGSPRDVAIDTAGNIYVVQLSAGAIIKYSGVDGSVIWNKRIPGTAAGELNEPWGVAYDHNRDLIYVSDRDPASPDNTIRVQAFNAADGTYASRSKSGIASASEIGMVVGGLHYTSYNNKDSLYVCAPAAYAIHCYTWTSSTQTLDDAALAYSHTAWGGGGGGPTANVNYRPIDVATDTDGISDVYVALQLKAYPADGRTLRFTHATFLANGAPTTAEVVRSAGVAVNPVSGVSYFTDDNANSLARKTAALAGTDWTFSGSGGDTLSAPYGVVLNMSDTTLWIANSGTGELFHVRDDGAGGQTLLDVITPPPGALQNPSDIAVDASGYVYVTNTGASKVLILNPNGTVNTEFGTAGTAAGQFNKPFGVAVDTDGYIFVSDMGPEAGTDPEDDDRIQVFYPLDHADSPLAYAGQSLTVIAVRGLHFAPARPNGIPPRLYAVSGRPEAKTPPGNTDDQRAFSVISVNASKAMTRVGYVSAIANGWLRDITSDWQGDIYLASNYMQVDGSLAGRTASKSVWAYEYNYGTNGATARGSFTLAPSAGNAGGVPAGVAVSPFGELFVADAIDHLDGSKGVDAVSKYHYNTPGSTLYNGGSAFWEFGGGIFDRPTALAYQAATTVEGTDKIWAIDYDNGAIRRYDISHDEGTAGNWTDVDIVYSTIQTDTPIVTAATIAGTNVRTVGSTLYAKEGSSVETVTITFSRTMDTSIDPTILLRSTVNSNELSCSKVTYLNNQWIGVVTTRLPATLPDGRVRFIVENAFDAAGETLAPNPTNNDTFSFILDVTKPNRVSVTQPSTPTSDATISVSGVAEDAVKIYRVYVYNDSGASGADLYDTVTLLDENKTTSWSWTATGMDLRPPPSEGTTENYVYAVAEDAAGNRSDPSDSAAPNDGARRLVERTDFLPGTGRISPDPSAGFALGVSQRFVLRWTAQTSMANDTISIVVPAGFSPPQVGAPTLEGYTKLGDSSGVTGLSLSMSGETILVAFASAASSNWFEVLYGDSAAGSGGLAYINNGSVGGRDVPVFGDNTFKMVIYNDGDTANSVPGANPAPGPDLIVKLIPETSSIANFNDGFAGDTQVARGATGEVMANFRVTNRNHVDGAKTVRVVSLTITVQDSAGVGMNANKVFSRLRVGDATTPGLYGTVNQAEIPAASNVTISLAAFNIDPGSSLLLYLYGDIDLNATADSFRVTIADSSAFVARVEADGSNATVSVETTSYPLATSKVRIYGLAAPDTIVTSRTLATNQTVSEGQVDVRPFRIVLANPIASRYVTLTRVKFRVVGADGTGTAPANVIKALKLVNASNSVVHVNDATIEGTGETITIDVPTTPNPAQVGGSAPDTLNLNVLVTINDTGAGRAFRLILVETGATHGLQLYDLAPTPTVEITNKRELSAPDTFPLISGLITIQRQAVIRNQAIRITDLAAGHIDTLLIGEQFKVEVGLAVDAGGANAQVRSADTDLIFTVTTTDKSSEFTILSRTHESLTTITAGNQDTIIYTVEQHTPFSGDGETLYINNRITSDTHPYAIDATSLTRVYLQEDSNSTDAIGLTMRYADVTNLTVTAASIAAATQQTQVLKFRITDNASADTLAAIQLYNVYPSTRTSIDSVFIRLDANKSGAYEAGSDIVFGDTLTFDSSDTITFAGAYPMAGAKDTITVFVLINLVDSPITDGETYDLRLTASGLGFAGRDSIPSSTVNSSGDIVARIIGTKLNVTPKSQSTSVGTSLTWTVEVTDAYGNRNRNGDNSSIQVKGTIRDTDPILSADWTAATLGTPSDISGTRDTIVTGNLVTGVGTVTMTDTEGETLAIAFTSTVTGETVTAVFTDLPSVTANPLSTIYVPADSTNALILDFTATNPTASDTIDSITIISENTDDADVKWVRLWVDGGDGVFNVATDQNVDTGVFSGGRVTFLTDPGEPVAEGTGKRFFVTYQTETSPLTDGDSLGARLDVSGCSFAQAGYLPTSGAIDSIENDASNARIRIDATATGGLISLSGASSSEISVALTLDMKATDAYGNVDRIFTTLGSNAAYNVTFTSTGDVVQFLSSSMTQVSGWPGTSPTARFKAGADTIAVKSDFAGDVTITASIGTHPPANDTHAVEFIGVEWELTALTITETQYTAGQADLVTDRFRLRNIGVPRDTVTTIVVKELGTAASADVARIEIYVDANGNSAFDTGVDTPFGSPATFSAGDTASFSGSVGVAGGGSDSRVFFIVAAIVASPVSAIGASIDIAIETGEVTVVLSDDSVPLARDRLSDSVAYTVELGEITADSLAIASDSVQPGATSVIVGRFYVDNGKGSADAVDSFTVVNDGDHPDTGITVRIVLDVNENGAYNAGTDVAFGANGGFVSGVLTRESTTAVAAGDSIAFLVLFDLSSTLTVDSRILRIRLEPGVIKMVSGDTAATKVLRSVGIVQTHVIPATTLPELDSVSIAAGSGIANDFDTAVVQVSIVDTNGIPAEGRSVTLTGDVGPPITVVSANPQTTGEDGMVRFALRTGTAGSYTYSASVDGVATGKSATASFIDENLSSGSNLGGNPTTNVPQSILTGLTTDKYFMGNVAFQGADTLVYVRAEGTNWELVKQTLGGGVTPLLQMNQAPGVETGQINFLSSVRVANTHTALGNKSQALAGIITRASGRRAQIYAVDLDSPGDSIRITPNNPADTRNIPFASIAWRWFDIDPTGETIITVQDGNLVLFWRTSGVAFDTTADSVNIRYVTAFTNAYNMGTAPAANTAIYAAYPSWSPDGDRIALSVIYVSDVLPNGPAVTRSEIYVLKNLGGLTLGGYPVLSPFPSLTSIGDANFVPVVTGDSFAFMPRWTRDGSGLIYTVARGAGWDWQNVFKGYPHTIGTYENGDFATRFIYYDKGGETAPYAPIDIANEDGAALGSLDVTMSPSGTARLAYIRKTTTGGNQTFEMRTVDLGTEATVSSQGGVLFDSGRIIVVVPSSESYASGFKIASATPATSPGGADSVIITGAAKNFFSPADSTLPVYFADSVTIFLYYGMEDFTETELMGYDSDDDDIPDRTEANVSAWYWNGATWIEYPAVRYPAENKIEFRTMHFSKYAIGLPMAVRTAAFLGSVHDVVVYPNPWRSDGPTANLAVTDERYGIKLTNFPDGQVRVRIYTLSGELVADGSLNNPGLGDVSTSPSLAYTGIENNGRGTVRWNLQNQAGNKIASGVYLVVLEGPGGRATRKVAIIR